HMPIGHGIPLGGLPTLPVVGSTAPAQPDTGTVGVARPAVTSSTATAAVQALGHAVAGTTAERGTAGGWRAIIAWPPTLPGLPGPQPLAPVTVPAAPGTTSGSGGSAGSGGLGLLDQSGLPATPGLDLVRVLRPTSALCRVTAGKQPGTTPD